jgi:hypothetical protein
MRTRDRLARLEAKTPQDLPSWCRMIWDPATGETLEEATAREVGADYTGNLIIREIVHPRPRPETEIDQ